MLVPILTKFYLEANMKIHRATWLRRLLFSVAFVGVAGAGAMFALQSRSPAVVDGVATASSDKAINEEEARSLELLQSSLKNSLVLPSNFKRVPAFTLSDVDSEPLTETLFEGQWSLVFFGFTNCPDVCPTTLSVVNGVVEQLEQEGVEPPQVVFVTVDPGRDTAARMKDYVAYFNDKFVGVTGELNALLELTRKLGIVVAFTANEENPEHYNVDHTASLMLIDPQRRVRAKLNAPHEVETIVADFLELRNGLIKLN